MGENIIKKWKGTSHGPQVTNHGFTLVEIILSITLTAILFTLSGLILRQGLDSYAHISSRSAALQKARYAMERMVRELRRVGDEPTKNIQNIQPTRITFVDDQGLTTDFNLNGQILQRGNDRLLDNVISLTFTGYKDDNQVTPAGPQVRRIGIQFSMLPLGETVSILLRTNVFIRNYMYENFQ